MKDKYLMLVRRELWEHRTLWLAPLIAAGLVVAAAAFGQFGMGPGELEIDGSRFNPTLNPGQVAHAGAIAMVTVAGFLTAISGIVVFTYLLDCLFAERKDRSILFWKSLPVSDAETVVSKFLVAMVVIPALVLLLALVLQPLLVGVMYLRFEGLRPFVGTGLFSGTLAGLGRVGVSGLFAALWFAPLGSYLMLASVAAKRAPLLYAALPPFALFVAEKIIFGRGSNHVGRFIGERVFPWPPRLPQLYGWGPNGVAAGEGHWWLVFTDAKLWLGLVAAAGMMYIIIRLRRYRDDT
ncbi:MAG: ABC-2 transporter permease [Steroidobacteraceae bacterium]